MLLGTWIMLPNTTTTEILALQKFDYYVIDTQHSNITLDILPDLIRTIRLHNPRAEIYIRIDINKFNISKCLDYGADGLVIPNIESEEEIDEVLSYVNYQPYGKRSFGLLMEQKYGLDVKDKLIKVYIQIECKLALENAPKLLNKKIHGYIIGPYDLSLDMSCNQTDIDIGEMENIEKSLIQIAKETNKLAGYHIVHPTKKIIKDKIDMGYGMIALGVDGIMLLDKSKEILTDANY